MNREYHAWMSPSLGRPMQMLVFGHAGEPVIVFPTSGGQYYEWEDFKMMDAMRDRIDAGVVQFFCVDSVDRESWYNKSIHPSQRIARDDAFDRYLVNEVVPFVRSRNSRAITLAGASFGGYHAIDKGLRHPEIFSKLISMSGAYDMGQFLSGYSDLGTYLHQPLAYLPDLHDPFFIDHIRNQTIILAIGDRDFLLNQNVQLEEALHAKGLPCILDLWHSHTHDWPAWREMIRKHIW